MRISPELHSDILFFWPFYILLVIHRCAMDFFADTWQRRISYFLCNILLTVVYGKRRVHVLVPVLEAITCQRLCKITIYNCLII